MSTNGEIISQDYTSSIDNIEINDWTKIQMTNTLNLLNGESQSSFYKIEGEKVIYNMDTVKDYLTHICKKENGMLKTYKEMTDGIRSENIESGNKGGATSARTIAVQIALEYLGYDVGKIDGNLGGDTGKAIKEYQKKHNLRVDGQPRPKVIDLLLKDIKVKQEVTNLQTNMLKNEEKFGRKGLVEINSDGTIRFTEKGVLEAKQWYYDAMKTLKGQLFATEDFNDFEKSKPFIQKMFDGIMKPGEYRALEVANSKGKRIRFILSQEDVDITILGLLMNGSIDDLRISRIIPNCMLGFDAPFLNLDKNLKIMEEFRENGVTMEESKPFLEKYMASENIYDIGNINYEEFFEENLNSDMLKFIFGNNVHNLNQILPISMKEGLLFYKMKIVWGNNFSRCMTQIIGSGVLNCMPKDQILQILYSNRTINELPKYLTLCKYLSSKNINEFPKLYGYTSEEYLNILKYMDIFGIPCDEIMSYNGMKKCGVLYRNNIPGTAYYFFRGIDNDGEVDKLLEELFTNESGKDLFSFLSQYPQALKNLGGKEIRTIELNTKEGGYNFCFRGILEMIKSTGIQVPNLKRDGKPKWKKGRERIIREYENLLRNYIALDKDKNGDQIPTNKTFDKIFFASALDCVEEDGNGSFHAYDVGSVLKNFTNEKNFEDCSNIIKNGKLNNDNQKNMIENIKKYVATHSNEKILVYLGYHGSPNGHSSNGRNKEQRIELSNISPNIKIMSTRCYFGSVYSNDISDKGNNIYSLQSSLSGSSNKTSGDSDFDKAMQEGYAKGLGFHELQIYARLNYNYSFTPLTEYMDYIDFRTGKKNHKIVGLADAGIGSGRDDIA